MELTTIVIMTVFVTLNVIVLFGYLGIAISIGKISRELEAQKEAIHNISDTIDMFITWQGNVVECFENIADAINEQSDGHKVEIPIGVDLNMGN